MEISNLMSTDVVSVAPAASLDSVAQVMREYDVGAVPVVDEGQLVGIVTDRDIVVRAVADSRETWLCRVGDVMSTDVQTCGLGADLEDVLQAMADYQCRRMPILDDAGMLVGMVSLADLTRDEDGDGASFVLGEVSEPVHFVIE